MKKLTELGVGDHAILPPPKVHSDKIAIHVERHHLLESGVADDVFEFVKGDLPIPIRVKESKCSEIEGIRY